MRVTFSADAERDLKDIYDHIEDAAGASIAEPYVRRLYDYCLSFAIFPQRGAGHDDIRPGLRSVGYRRRATISFLVRADVVVILRVFHKGRQILLDDV
jgi:plasmid stabilization system protein ParE